MSPYFCYIHNGLYVSSPHLEGCQDVQCRSFAEKEVAPVGVMVAGFAGSTATKISRRNHNQFNKDMNAYKAARDQGVKPDQITAKAAETALKAAEAGN